MITQLRLRACTGLYNRMEIRCVAETAGEIYGKFGREGRSARRSGRSGGVIAWKEGKCECNASGVN